LETVQISFDVETSDAECPLGIQIWLNDLLLADHPHVKEKIAFAHDMSDDDDSKCQLRIVMYGKTADHTQVDDQGNIVKDATLQISAVTIDGIDVNQLFLDRCVYTHDFNGTQPKIEDTFHGMAGCNGTIVFEFTTPIYLWLLENM
jgi:hypothetical protein